jgi:hypothetical protein
VFLRTDIGMPVATFGWANDKEQHLGALVCVGVPNVLSRDASTTLVRARLFLAKPAARAYVVG